MKNEIEKDLEERKIKNFDNLMADFDAYIAPVAEKMGWFKHYSKINWVPKSMSGDADQNGHNPFQVLICLALQCENWKQVCDKNGSLYINLFGKAGNL